MTPSPNPLESVLQYLHTVLAVHTGALLQPPWGNASLRLAQGSKACNQWILEKNCGTSYVLPCVRRHGGERTEGDAVVGTRGLGSGPELRNLAVGKKYYGNDTGPPTMNCSVLLYRLREIKMGISKE